MTQSSASGSSAACRGSGTCAGTCRRGACGRCACWQCDSTDAPTPGRARALFARGGIELMMQGDAAAARVSLAESAALFRTQNDRRRLAHALTLLGVATTSRREPALALTIYAEAVELARAEGDAWLEAFALANQGAATELVGDLKLADALYRASLTLFSRLNDAWGRGLALRELGGLAAARGDYASSPRGVRRERGAVSRERRCTRPRPSAAWPGQVRAPGRRRRMTPRRMFAEALARWRDLGIKVGLVRSMPAWAEWRCCRPLRRRRQAVRVRHEPRREALASCTPWATRPSSSRRSTTCAANSSRPASRMPGPRVRRYRPTR